MVTQLSGFYMQEDITIELLTAFLQAMDVYINEMARKNPKYSAIYKDNDCVFELLQLTKIPDDRDMPRAIRKRAQMKKRLLRESLKAKQTSP